MRPAGMVVGRSSKADIVVDDATVSRSHLKLTQIGDDLYSVEDLGSKGGTFVEENTVWRRVQKVTIPESSRIRLGHYITTIPALMSARKPAAKQLAAAQAEPNKPGGKFRRNPLTGEIMPNK